ncbi:MAG TPA: thiamine phosphate synthase [Vicinamibacterales bacterium]
MIRYLVTDRRRFGLNCDELTARVARAARGGATHIQIRERDLTDESLAQLARDVARAVSGTAARVLVNDRADVAIAAAAHGVHLPADSVSASRIRGLVPSGFLVGRSVHTLDEVDRAVADGGCDYLLFGTIFPSFGKPPGHPVAGLEMLREVCARSPLPVIAIGGMTGARAAEVVSAGAAGLAGVTMFM